MDKGNPTDWKAVQVKRMTGSENHDQKHTMRERKGKLRSAAIVGLMRGRGLKSKSRRAAERVSLSQMAGSVAHENKKKKP